MSKEKQIQEYESKQLIEALSKMPPMVIATAYLHAINYTMYGEDVTEKWLTATQNASALEKAFRRGYYDALDALQRQVESTPQPKIGRWKWVPDKYEEYPILGDWICSECKNAAVECVRKDYVGGIPLYKYCPQCGCKMQEEQTTKEVTDDN